MPAKVTRDQGKGMFVKEVLNDNPLANAEAVNEAWRAAGMSGGISASLVSNMRSRMGLAGNLRPRASERTKTTGARPSRPASRRFRPVRTGRVRSRHGEEGAT